MKPQYKTLIFLLLIPGLLLATDGKFKGKFTKEKTINKEYTVNADAELRIDNSYGNLDIVSWNQNKTVIEVTIRTNGNNEEKVLKRLTEIDVEFSANASLVSAMTKFKKRSNNWNIWGNNKKNGVSMEVNYIIKVPATNTVDLSNDYGAINLNRLEGSATISCDYGQVNIGELLADNNRLSFDYTNSSSIEYMKNGKINADYSQFTLGKSEYLDLNADYTKSTINQVNDLDYSCDYGKLTVDNVTNVTGNGDYIPTKFGNVSGGFNINSDYGSITVDRFTATAKNVSIKSSYAGIKLGFDPGYNFDFNVNLSYASFKDDNALNIETESKDNSRKSYTGYHGSKASGNTISVRSSYGGVSLTKQ